MFWLQCGIGFICTLNRRINTWLQVLFEHYFIPVELFQRPKAHTITCVGIMNCPARCKCEPQGYPRYHEFHRDRWSPTSMRQRVLCSTWKLNFTDLKIKKAEKKKHGEHHWESYRLPTSTRHLCAHLHLFLIHAFGPRDGVEGAIDVPDHQIHSDSNITLGDEKSLWNQQVFLQVIRWSAWTQYHAHVLKLLENKNKNDAFHTKNIWTSRLLRSGSLLWSLAAPWLL